MRISFFAAATASIALTYVDAIQLSLDEQYDDDNMYIEEFDEEFEFAEVSQDLLSLASQTIEDTNKLYDGVSSFFSLN